MKSYIHTKKGFTLAEMVIYMGILSFLLVVFIDMFAVLVNKQLETESLSAVQQDSNYIFSRLSYDFGRATSIDLPSVPSTASGILRLYIDSTAFDYYASASSFIASISGSPNQLNSTETTISNVSFRRLGEGNSSDVVQIACDISSNIKQQSGYEVIHFSTTLGIRDK